MVTVIGARRKSQVPSGSTRRVPPSAIGTIGRQPHDRSDYQAVRDGYVSVTPLQPDLTAHAALPLVEALSLEMRAEVE
jgi:broad specificity polyphosphatase/5'/3'-nucleotidase SurE